VARAFLVVELLPDLPGQGKGAAAVGHVHGEDDQDADRGADGGVGDGDGEARSSAAEDSLPTVVFLSIWGGGAGVGEWGMDRAAAPAEPLAARSQKNEGIPTRTRCRRQLMGLGPSTFFY
jgi:hypothetical protein